MRRPPRRADYQENGMDLEKLVLIGLFCVAGAIAYAVGSELRKKKIARENHAREKADKERAKAGKKAKKKNSP